MNVFANRECNFLRNKIAKLELYKYEENIYSAYIVWLLRTSYFGSPVQRESSRNSNCNVVTSAVVESGLHLGTWAMRDAKFISENGIGDGDFVKHGNSLSPRSA